ncbi:acylglycerol kinase family protein [Phaeacidiphilus oryzae]|uniref:acylglycerol kinase family protein n=1 Tax=Phaeacidiphilus oryzae TaxID=348818 RepID=UPI001F287146|nr:acylglycerol kinase family protein [Phaeacidiphilus oryzae]
MRSAAEPGTPLLLVVAPTARRVDAEAVRVARDVLSAATSVKLALPEDLPELDRMLTHRGRRRPVVIGDDRALHHVVRLLHRQSALGTGPIGLVPVGEGTALATSRALGIPARPEEAARAVLRGADRQLDLLVDEDGGVVLGAVRIPGREGGGRAARGGPGAAGRPPIGADRSPGANTIASSSWTSGGPGASRAPGAAAEPELPGPAGRLARLGGAVGEAVSGAVRGALPGGLPGGARRRLRIEADGRVLAEPGQPIRSVAVEVRGGGRMEIRIQAHHPLYARARQLVISGAEFEYLADSAPGGPVERRIWTVQPGAWRLHVPLPRG